MGIVNVRTGGGYFADVNKDAICMVRWDTDASLYKPDGSPIYDDSTMLSGAFIVIFMGGNCLHVMDHPFTRQTREDALLSTEEREAMYREARKLQLAEIRGRDSAPRITHGRTV